MHVIQWTIVQLAEAQPWRTQADALTIRQGHKLLLPADMRPAFAGHTGNGRFVELISIGRMRQWPAMGIASGPRQPHQ
ncbi:hypothetical protein D9M71_706040 [compost metagenome]